MWKLTNHSQSSFYVGYSMNILASMEFIYSFPFVPCQKFNGGKIELTLILLLSGICGFYRDKNGREEINSILVIPGTKNTHSPIKVLCTILQLSLSILCESSPWIYMWCQKRIYSLFDPVVVSITMSHLMHVGSIVYSSMVGHSEARGVISSELGGPLVRIDCYRFWHSSALLLLSFLQYWIRTIQC